MMNDPRDTLPRTTGLIEKGMEERLHVGTQLYVSVKGEPVADYAVGLARPDVPMTTNSMMIWHSSTKAVGAVAMGQLWEQGKFDVDDKVCQYIPEFGNKGKEAITIRHVLTHTGGFRFADRPDRTRHGAYPGTWDEIIARICAAELEDGWVPGKKAGYHPTSGWFILGEIVRRLDGRPYDRYVREEIFEPLGANDCWIGMPVERYQAYGDRIADMYDTAGEVPAPVADRRSEASVTRCVPGGNGRGPMNQLAKMYEMLLARGFYNGRRFLRPQTVEAATARHRVGMHDVTFNSVRDWGLGVSIDQINFGRHCSARAFGHSGSQSSVAFADPEYGLAVGLVCNGMPGPIPHVKRQEAITTKIYEDLGLAEPGSPGKEHPMPHGSVK